MESAGTLRAFASIQVGKLIMHDFRVVQQDGQRAYVQPPQAEYSRDGKRQFKPLLSYPPEWKEQIEAAIIEAWKNE